MLTVPSKLKARVGVPLISAYLILPLLFAASPSITHAQQITPPPACAVGRNETYPAMPTTYPLDRNTDNDQKNDDQGIFKNTDDDRRIKTPPIGADVTVNFVTTAITPLNPGFNGFNSNLKNAVEYGDRNFQNILKTLSPG